MIKRIPFVIAIVLWQLLIVPVRAQHISKAMQFISPVQEKDTSSLLFSYSNLAYFRNYEYFNNIQTGYTLFGIWQYPRLSYVANKWMKIEAGVLLQKDFGDNSYTRTFPTISLQVQKNGYRFLFGALEGNLSHDLIEPLQQYDQIIERPIEEGAQLKIDKKKFKGDIWIDWQRRQTLNASTPEQLVSGFSLSYDLRKEEKPFKLKLPLQVTTFHRGGQLDTNDVADVTVFNYAAGLWGEWNNPAASHWLKQIRADGYYTGFNRSQSSIAVPFTRGSGWLVNMYLRSKWDIAFLATYWSGHNFAAPIGGKIYKSVSSIGNTPGYTESRRSLLFLNLLFEKELAPGLFTDIRMTPYFDLRNSLFEYSYQLLLSYRHDFRLIRIKKR
jgi:hypothetical protein